MKALLLRHRHLTAMILLAIVLACVWFFKSETGHGWRVDLWNHASNAHDLLGSAPPWAYFTVTGILPLLGIPMVSFYLLTASMYSPHVAILGTAYAITLNLLLSYGIGRFGHRAITALIARTGRAIPQIPPKHRIWMTAAVRVTPGAPLLVQNYLLVLAGVPLMTFVLVSLPLELLIAAGYVLLGHSLFTGNWKMLLLAAVIVAAAVVVFRTLRKRSEVRSKALGIVDPAGGAVNPAAGILSPPASVAQDTATFSATSKAPDASSAREAPDASSAREAPDSSTVRETPESSTVREAPDSSTALVSPPDPVSGAAPKSTDRADTASKSATAAVPDSPVAAPLVPNSPADSPVAAPPTAPENEGDTAATPKNSD